MDHESGDSVKKGTRDHGGNELDLAARLEQAKELLSEVLAKDWKRIIAITVLVAIIAAAWSYTITPIYKVTVVVQVKGKLSKGGGVLPLADLAVAAGMPVPVDETADAAIGKLKSDAFARSFIKKERLTDTLLGEQVSFLPRWLSFRALLPSDTPGGISDEYRKLEMARQIFSKKLDIIDDRKTQLLTLVLYWESDPVMAADLANKLIRQVNEYMRQQAVENSQKSINYLNAELSKTTLVPVQQAIYRMMEEQVKTQMAAGVSDDFALRFIDPASPPIQRDSPRRKLIVSTAVLLAFVITTLLFARRRLAASIA